jgi:hypothetical protein
MLFNICRESRSQLDLKDNGQPMGAASLRFLSFTEVERRKITAYAAVDGEPLCGEDTGTGRRLHPREKFNQRLGRGAVKQTVRIYLLPSCLHRVELAVFVISSATTGTG